LLSIGLVVAACSPHLGRADGFRTDAAAIKTGQYPMMRKSLSPMTLRVLAIALATMLAAAVGGVVMLAIQVQGVFI
jgi:hypothetical protein